MSPNKNTNAARALVHVPGLNEPIPQSRSTGTTASAEGTAVSLCSRCGGREALTTNDTDGTWMNPCWILNPLQLWASESCSPGRRDDTEGNRKIEGNHRRPAITSGNYTEGTITHGVHASQTADLLRLFTGSWSKTQGPFSKGVWSYPVLGFRRATWRVTNT